MFLQNLIIKLRAAAPSDIFWHFHFFTDYDTKSNYTPPVKKLAATCPSNWCFLTFKHFFSERILSDDVHLCWVASDSAERS